MTMKDQTIKLLETQLADAEGVDRIEVEWPSGHRQVITGPIASNRRVEVVEISP